MEVLLLNPDTYQSELRPVTPGRNVAAYYHDNPGFEHIGLAYIGSYLRVKGHNVCLVDLQVFPEDVYKIRQFLRTHRRVLVGIAMPYEGMLPCVQRIVKLVRTYDSASFIVVGGMGVSFLADEVLMHCTEVDAICIGEGEAVMAQLCDQLDSHVLRLQVDGLVTEGCTTRRTVAQNPFQRHEQPRPARDYAERAIRQGLALPVVGSMGCIHACSFCCGPVLRPKYEWSPRAVPDIADELEQLHKDYGARQIEFMDENFLGNEASRANELSSALIERDIRISFGISLNDYWLREDVLRPLLHCGLKTVFVGLESPIPYLQSRYGKSVLMPHLISGVRLAAALGIEVVIGLLMFGPYSTCEHIEQTIQAIRPLLDVSRVQGICQRIEVFHGAPIYKDLREEGLLFEDGLHAWHGFEDPRTQLVFDVVRVVHDCKFEPLLLNTEPIKHSIEHIDTWRQHYRELQLAEWKLVKIICDAVIGGNRDMADLVRIAMHSYEGVP